MPIATKNPASMFSKTISELERLDSDQWQSVEANQEGELSIDVYQDKNNLYVQSTVAGVKPEDLKISVHHDMLTIRGEKRRNHQTQSNDYFYQECFWGTFSRSIILPFNIKSEKIKAEITDGVLTVTLPKLKRKQTIPITVS